MHKLPYFALATFAFLPVLGSACSNDPQTNNGDDTGATDTGASTSTGGKGSGGKSSGGKSSGGKSTNTAGDGEPVPLGGGDTTDPGGAGPVGGDCDLSGEGKERVDILNPIDFDFTLTSDKVWVIRGLTYVTSGATLSIDPCTRIEGASTEVSALIITRGLGAAPSAKIMAEGTENSPILFTSDRPIGDRLAGDWGGVALLGKAPTNIVPYDTNVNGILIHHGAFLEGVVDATKNEYGGNDPEDSSGVITYTRIEYAGYAIATDTELNGLTLASVGSGTKLSHIEVNAGFDDCFEWFGGTVNADHLICNTDGDDMFDTDGGFSGTLSYLFGRKRANPSTDPNGFESDNDRTVNDSKPVTNPTYHNVTMCGFGFGLVNTISYGMVLRRGAAGIYDNIVLTGFDFGVDVRDSPINPYADANMPFFPITNSTFFGNLGADVVDPNDCNDVNFKDETGTVTSCHGLSGLGDSGFNEDDWFQGKGEYTTNTGNSTESPGFTIDDCQADDGPNEAVTGSGTGAFKDGNWLKGAWIDWADK